MNPRTPLLARSILAYSARRLAADVHDITVLRGGRGPAASRGFVVPLEVKMGAEVGGSVNVSRRRWEESNEVRSEMVCGSKLADVRSAGECAAVVGDGRAE